MDLAMTLHRSPEGAPNEDIWSRVRGRLRGEVGEAAFRSWLQPLTLLSVRDGTVRMAVPTRFMRDWVQTNYAERIKQLWAEEDAATVGIEVVVQPPARPQPKPGDPRAGEARSERGLDLRQQVAHAVVDEPGRPGGRDGKDEERRDLSAPLDNRFTFDNFVVGKPNELAYAAARRVAEAKDVPFNPLFLYGGVGLGKTHLMHAIAWQIKKRTPNKRLIYITAENFLYQFVNALRTKDTMAFKAQFRTVDVLLIDDLQFIAGREATQEEFFHTFNSLVDQNRQVVVSADKSPHDLEGMEERMRSRLGYGLVADLHPTTYELRLGILASKAEQLGQPVPPKVLEFLAHKITSNVRELEGALNRVVAHTTLVGRSITLELAQEVLHDVLRANDRRVTIEEIQKRVAEHYNIKLTEMHSARRARAVARPRQVAMYLAKQLTSRSLPEIGRKFGGRDHTTVMHAVKKVEELKAQDHSFAEDVELLRRMLEG
jgi:chromosomal replication initiator protein